MRSALRWPTIWLLTKSRTRGSVWIVVRGMSMEILPILPDRVLKRKNNMYFSLFSWDLEQTQLYYSVDDKESCKFYYILHFLQVYYDSAGFPTSVFKNQWNTDRSFIINLYYYWDYKYSKMDTPVTICTGNMIELKIEICQKL